MAGARHGAGLADLGDRICVLGPSNSGKSTLSAAISAARDLPVVHLDQLRFRPGSDWTMRPDDEFAALHDAAVGGDRWVVEGNYTALLPHRLARATGFVLLDVPAAVSLVRYLRRTRGPHTRVGGLAGTTDRLDGSMVRWILGGSNSSRAANRRQFQAVTLPKVLLPSGRALRRFADADGLDLGLR